MNRRNVLKSLFVAAPVAVAAGAEVSASKEKPVTSNKLLMDMAVEIVKARNIQHIYYVNCGNLPRKRAEAYMKELIARYRDSVPAVWIPQRGDNQVSSMQVVPRPYSVDEVLAVYDQLKKKTAA